MSSYAQTVTVQLYIHVKNRLHVMQLICIQGPEKKSSKADQGTNSSEGSLALHNSLISLPFLNLIGKDIEKFKFSL